MLNVAHAGADSQLFGPTAINVHVYESEHFANFRKDFYANKLEVTLIGRGQSCFMS